MTIVALILLSLFTLRQRCKQLETTELLDNLPAGVIKLTKESRVTYFNKFAVELCGTAIETSFAAFLNGFEDTEKSKLKGALNIALSGQSSAVTTSLKHELGTKVFLDFHFLPLQNVGEHRKVNANSEIVVTINSSNFLGHAKEYLEAENREISKLSSAVSRELANATFSIDGLSGSNEELITQATRKISTMAECLSQISEAYLSRNYEVKLSALLPETKHIPGIGGQLVDASVTQYLLDILGPAENPTDLSKDSEALHFSPKDLAKHEEVLASYFARLIGADLNFQPEQTLLRFRENSSASKLISYKNTK